MKQNFKELVAKQDTEIQAVKQEIFSLENQLVEENPIYDDSLDMNALKNKNKQKLKNDFKDSQ